MATRRVKNVAYDDDDRDDGWWDSGDWDGGDWGSGGWGSAGWSESKPTKAADAKAKGKAAAAKPAAAKPTAAKPAAAKPAAAAPKASSSTATPKAKASPAEAKPVAKPAAKASADAEVLRLLLGDAVDAGRVDRALAAAGSSAEDAFLALLGEEIDAGRWRSGGAAPGTEAAAGGFDPPARAGDGAAGGGATGGKPSKKAEATPKKAAKEVAKGRGEEGAGAANEAAGGEGPPQEEPGAPDPKPEPSADVRPSISLVVVGHVDAGKSTLMGRLLSEVGVVSTKQLHKLKKESEQIGKGSFAFAWVLDEGEDERSRGVTIDVCVKHFATEGRRFTILDAPGHRDFVPNMIAGAVQADVALLVADVSHFEAGFERGGQTKEHLQLVRSLGISQVVVAINKLDTCDWSQETFERYKETLHAFIVGPECGFKASSVQYIPLSGHAGENMLERKEPKLSAWWDGPTLIQALDRLPPPPRPDASRPLRIPLSDLYKSGASITASGKVESGTVSVGQKVVLLPSNEHTVVKGLQIHDAPVKSGATGDYADAVVLPVEPQFACIGGAICDARHPVPVVDSFQAQILVFDLEMPLMRGQQLMCYIHTETLTATLAKLEKLIVKGQPQDKRPKCLQKGNSAIVQIKVSRKVCVEPKPEGKAPATSLSRLVLRDRGRTVAAGVILSVN